jgi:uncharacterized protein (TIGR03382 family)
MRSIGIVATLACLAACGDPESTSRVGATSQAVIGGSTDSTHTSVVSIVAAADASTPELCSGTVIAPRVVLTAGHCTLGQDPAGLVLGIGPSAASPTMTLAVAAVVTYPRFSGADDLPGGTDLGALVLAEDAPLPGVPLFVGDEAALVGGNVTVVGYGQSSASDLESSGSRREGTVGVVSACSALLSFGDATSNACHGDSGGPLLVVGDSGEESIAAVVSFGDEIDCATPSKAVRVDRYAAWIADVIADGASTDGATCTDCPSAALDCSEDGGSDASLPRDTSDASAGDEVPTGSSTTGGCSSAPGGASSHASLALVVLLTLLRRRSGTVAHRP